MDAPVGEGKPPIHPDPTLLKGVAACVQARFEALLGGRSFQGATAQDTLEVGFALSNLAVQLSRAAERQLARILAKHPPPTIQRRRSRS